MLSFTFRTFDGAERGPVILVMVIERENMVRMTTGDPFDVKLKAIARADERSARLMQYRNLTDLDIIIAYEDPAGIATIRDLMNRQDYPGVMKYIERGRTVYAGEPADPVKLA